MPSRHKCSATLCSVKNETDFLTNSMRQKNLSQCSEPTWNRASRKLLNWNLTVVGCNKHSPCDHYCWRFNSLSQWKWKWECAVKFRSGERILSFFFSFYAVVDCCWKNHSNEWQKNSGKKQATKRKIVIQFYCRVISVTRSGLMSNICDEIILLSACCISENAHRQRFALVESTTEWLRRLTEARKIAALKLIKTQFTSLRSKRRAFDHISLN